MSFILHIDTATENALVCISKDGHVLHHVTDSHQKNHAAFLHPAIEEVVHKSGIAFNHLNAIAVTEGPGSYTGLRVGMASAKGLCYALKLPLITLSTLEVMALSVIENTVHRQRYYYAPMIDARRMEIFGALYDHELNQVLPPAAMIAEESLLHSLPGNKKIIFSGTGGEKFMALFPAERFSYNSCTTSSSAITSLSTGKFNKASFTDLTAAEPLYLKPFFTYS